MTTNDIRASVFAALDNALENGEGAYDHRLDPVDDVVHELLTYDADLEMLTPDDIRDFVIEWQQQWLEARDD
jgi:hypothetical protein